MDAAEPPGPAPAANGAGGPAAVLDPTFLVPGDGLGTPAAGREASGFADVLDGVDTFAEQVGRVVRAHGTTVQVTGLTARIGERCRIGDPGDARAAFADVVAIDGPNLVLYLLGTLEGISNRSEVRVVPSGRTVPFSETLVGCVVDGAGRIVYQPHAQVRVIDVPIEREAPDALRRAPIDRIFRTGVRPIDALLTVGVGQRVGIFATAGGGKSTLLSMLARNAAADVNVIALIGERGREVREFIEHNLGAEGLARSVIVVSTSDRPAMERVNAARCATTIAEGFRARGKNVLLLLDSITRHARAMREVGLSIGEPPVRRGFPPSVFADLPRLLERTGNDEHGSITAFYTVLAEDEDGDDPIVEEVRSILDGHIVLARALGERGRYPPIDVLGSTSRLFPDLAGPEHRAAAVRVRRLLAKHDEIELLVQLGEYEPGSDPEADDAIARRGAIEALLAQDRHESPAFDDTLSALLAI